MSKSDQNRAKTQAQDQIARNTAQGDKAEATITDSLNTAKQVGAGVLPGITSGYADIAGTGGFTNDLTGELNPAYMGYATAAGNTFGDLATTGGISDTEAGAIRGRASNTASAAYGSAANAAARASGATGGYGLSGATFSNLARTGSQAAEKAAIDAEASIAGLRQQGKSTGAYGLSQLSSSLQSGDLAAKTAKMQASQQQAANRLGALSGASNIYGLSVNQQNSLMNQMLQNYQQTGQLNQGDLNIYTSLANQPGWFDKTIGTIGTLAGAAGGIMTGYGAASGKMAPRVTNQYG